MSIKTTKIIPYIIYSSIFLAVFCTISVNASSISISVSNNTAEFDLLPTASESAFGSASITANIATDHTAGYTFTISGKDNEQKLKGTGTNALNSIEEPVEQSTFENLSNTEYDNKWGFLPSKLNGNPNTKYQPSPKNNPATTIDITDTANTNPNPYTLAIGARANTTTPKDSYTTTFTLAVSANATHYSIGYVDLLSNMPTATAGSTTGTTVTLSDTIPSRDGYTFKGWCSQSTSDNTCSGTIYSANGTYALSNGTITNLYAMWEEVPGGAVITYDMQSVSTWKSNLKVGDIVTVKDTRDGRTYKAGKMLDGKIWMLDNLAFNGKDNQGDGTYIKLTSQNTNVVSDVDTDSTWNWTSSYSYTAPKINTGKLGSVPTDAVSANGGFDSGAYYNYCAASARTVCESSYSSAPDTSHDICPKDWHLPSGGTSTSSDLMALYSALGGPILL